MATALAIGAIGVMGAAPPAGAAVVVTSSGTAVTATITGSSLGFSSLGCTGGQVRVDNVPAAPAVACAALTALTMNADDAAQTFGPPSAPASFPDLGTITINAGGGIDVVNGSTFREVVVGGAGNDRVNLPASGADDSVGLGSSGTDVVSVIGTAGSDTITVATGNPTTRTVVTRGTWDVVATTTDTVMVLGGAQGDELDASGVTAASTLKRVELEGEGGNDLVVCGAKPCVLTGDDGSNGLIGGPATDFLYSASPSDTFRGNGGNDHLIDTTSGRVGRDIDPTGNGGFFDYWSLQARGDVAIRTRNTGTTDAGVTVALARTGRQWVREDVGLITYDIDAAPVDRAVLDLAPVQDQDQEVNGDSGTAVDIVVPSGSWNIAGGLVTFTGDYEPIEVAGTSAVLVRAPFTNANERYAHRLLRDVRMRLPTPAERSALKTQLDGGTSRPNAVLGLTNTDGYRGLVVDRAFIGILRRGTDLDGRNYWIQRLEDGLVTRRLRANLYGSPEYVTKAGGTNPLYVAAAYRDILGRTAVQADIDYWVAQIEDVGLPRGTVADRFLNTHEARQVVIRDLFRRWADREPEDSELITWTPQLGSSSTDGELALYRTLAASAEYFNRPDA